MPYRVVVAASAAAAKVINATESKRLRMAASDTYLLISTSRKHGIIVDRIVAAGTIEEMALSLWTRRDDIFGGTQVSLGEVYQFLRGSEKTFHGNEYLKIRWQPEQVTPADTVEDAIGLAAPSRALKGRFIVLLGHSFRLLIAQRNSLDEAKTYAANLVEGFDEAYIAIYEIKQDKSVHPFTEFEMVYDRRLT